MFQATTELAFNCTSPKSLLKLSSFVRWILASVSSDNPWLIEMLRNTKPAGKIVKILEYSCENVLLVHRYEDMWVSSAEGQKLFQHQHWFYMPHYAVAFLIISIISLIVSNNFIIFFLQLKKKKKRRNNRREKRASASLQFGFAPWDHTQISKLAKIQLQF